MPELPEVETVVRNLQKVLPGSRIIDVRMGKTDFIDDPAAIARDVPGNQVIAVRRHGKFIVLDLKNPDESAPKVSLLVHLGMTGRLATSRIDAEAPKHTHVHFVLDDGRELRYTDARRFGRMCVVEDAARDRVLGELGVDALDVKEKEFAAILAKRSARIKALLLDQTILRGMGNIYSDEALWRARIHPAKISSKLTKSEAHNLVVAMREVLKEAIRLKGSSIADFVYGEGNRGKFQHRHQVYQREGEKCFRCGAKIRRSIVAGRSSHFCPRCQPAPRAGASDRATRKIRGQRKNTAAAKKPGQAGRH